MNPVTRLAIGAGALVTACVLGVSPEGLGLTCRFAGDETTACGACIARSCRAAVDACCRDRECTDNGMPALDACSTGTGCAKLLARTGDLTSCVRASCASACGDDDAGAPSDLVVSCALQSDALGKNACRCDALSPFADAGLADGLAPTTSCGPGSFGVASGACCAFKGWPDGGSCLCAAVRCEVVTGTTPESCTCGLFEQRGLHRVVHLQRRIGRHVLPEGRLVRLR